MGISRLAALAALTLGACQTTSATSPAETDGNFGNFVEVPSGWQALYVDQHGEEFHYGSSDVSDRIFQCEKSEYGICVYSSNKSLAFIVPRGELRAGDSWSELGFAFKVAKVIFDTAYIDVKLPESVNDMMRFFYKDGAVLGFSYGTPVTRKNCENCFDARITYIWTGEGGFRLPPSSNMSPRATSKSK